MLLNHIFLAFLWALYGVLHSVLAAQGLKEKLRQALGNRYRYYRLFYTLFAFAGLTALLLFQINMHSPLLFEVNMFALGAGLLLSFGGLVLMLTCIAKYFLSLSGLKSLFNESHRNKLIISGVHRYVRHPLYLGTFAFVWGLLLLLPYASLFTANLVITAYTLIGIGLEEQKLVKEFGSDYLAYRQKVPALLPFRRKKGAKQETVAGNLGFAD